MSLSFSVPRTVFIAIGLALAICDCDHSKKPLPPSHPDLSAQNGIAASDQDISNPLERSSPGIVRWVQIPELPKELAIMESVFWEPDVIISNPPWENSQPTNVEEFALYDPDFALLESLITGARKRLKPNGRMWLAYGSVTAIRRIQELASKEKLICTILDERNLDNLPEIFLRGMLIEIRVPNPQGGPAEIL